MGREAQQSSQKLDEHRTVGATAGLMQNHACLAGVLSFRGKRACANIGTFRGFGGFRGASSTRQRDAELPAAKRPVNWRLPSGHAPGPARASSVISTRLGTSGKQRSSTCSPKQHGETYISKEGPCTISTKDNNLSRCFPGLLLLNTTTIH